MSLDIPRKKEEPPPTHTHTVQGATEDNGSEKLTLYVDVGGPVPFDVRRLALTAAVEGRIIVVAETGGGCVAIVEGVGERGEVVGWSGGRMMGLFGGDRLGEGGTTLLLLVAIRVVDERHVNINSWCT